MKKALLDKINKEVKQDEAREEAGSKWGNIFKVSRPGTYLLKLLPNNGKTVTTLERVFYAWKKDGEFTRLDAPITWGKGQGDPIFPEYKKLFKEHGKDHPQVKDLKRKRDFLVNALVLQAPIGDDGESRIGDVVVLSHSAGVRQVIKDGHHVYGTEGIYGHKPGDKKGVLLQVKTTKKGEWPSYAPTLIPVEEPLTEERHDELTDKAFDLWQFVDTTVTNEQLKEALDKYFGATETGPAEDDDVPF